MPQTLNENARRLVADLIPQQAELRVAISQAPCGTTILDCGVKAPGGIEAGRQLAEICLAGLGKVSVVPASAQLGGGAAIQIVSDQPLRACMASQYAGWQISGEKFFAMGSGPMRAAAGKEAIFERIGQKERPPCAVGVLETAKLPPDEVCRKLADSCGVPPSELTLLAARTASLAGTVQVVARSLETALHKIGELGGELAEVVSGFGVAPLPPVAADDLTGIGRTNDAILYGGDVTIWVRGEDAAWSKLLQEVPSSASRDFGRPFAEIFEAAGKDFYKIDPHLFSPARVTLVNLSTGRQMQAGELRPDILKASFGS